MPLVLVLAGLSSSLLSLCTVINKPSPHSKLSNSKTNSIILLSYVTRVSIVVVNLRVTKKIECLEKIRSLYGDNLSKNLTSNKFLFLTKCSRDVRVHKLTHTLINIKERKNTDSIIQLLDHVLLVV